LKNPGQDEGFPVAGFPLSRNKNISPPLSILSVRDDYRMNGRKDERLARKEASQTRD